MASPAYKLHENSPIGAEVISERDTDTRTHTDKLVI
jgi:hypothetical protein